MTETPFNWKCPHCERAVTISSSRYQFSAHTLKIANTTGVHSLQSEFIVCPNSECAKYSLEVQIVNTGLDTLGNRVVTNSISKWRLFPWGASRSIPEFVPQAIRDDYAEACSIVGLSPKAAATLARRAVQGIVRDYWGIVRPTLNKELEALAELVGKDVTRETWEGIDAVRSVGNIGAHMEKDINVIVDVDPDEALLLIELVENLIEDTYIAKNAREQHLAKLLELKARKQAEKASG